MTRLTVDPLYRATLDVSQDAFYVLAAVRADGEIVDFEFETLNSGAERRLGVTLKEIRGRRVLDRFPTSQMHTIVERYKEVIRTGNQYCARIRSVTNERQWVDLNVGRIDEDRIAVTVRDVTHEVEKESQLKAAVVTARHERDFADTVLATVSALVCVADREGRFVRFNGECERLTGYSEAEVLGRYYWDVVLLPEEAPAVRKVIEQVVARDFPQTFENHWRTRSGERRLLQWRNTALLDENGEVEFVIATGNDITEERQAQEKLKQSMRALHEAHVQLEIRHAELEEANLRLRHLARTDGLTGIWNHNAFHERLMAEASVANRANRRFSILMMDVDFFKAFNDAHGHPAGDKLLASLSEILRGRLRPCDFLARYGGEEFAAILPDTESHEAQSIAERLRREVESSNFDGNSVTISIGCATYEPGEPGTETLVRSDNALYAAKHGGRNVLKVA